VATREARLVIKRTAVPGKIPSGTTGNELNLIRQGELAINTADYKLFSFDGADVFEIGAKSYLSLSGGTVSGDTNFTGNLSAITFFSGSTNLETIINNIAGGADTRVRIQPGINTFTGGTELFPTINITGASLDNLFVSGSNISNSFSATSVSATTFYSAGTELSQVLNGLDTFITGGTNSSGGTLTLERNDGNNVVVTGVASTEQVILEDNLLEFYQSATTTTSTAGIYSDIPWDSEIFLGADYTQSGPEITFVNGGIYEVEYSVSLDVNAGGRKTARSRIVLDEGSGFGELVRSGSFSYHRSTAAGEDTANKTIKQRFSAGDIIKIQTSVFSGGGTLVTIANDSNVTITKLAL